MIFRKSIFLLVYFFIVTNQISGQDTINPCWKAGVGFDHDFYIYGYVQVRENQYEGTRLSLDKHLGMKDWNSVTLHLIRSFRNSSALTISVEYFLFHGHSSVDNDIWFNATHLDGTAGLSIETTKLYRAQICWNKPVFLSRDLNISINIGLIYDGMEFRIDGTVFPGSPRNEAREDFISQALPYPMVGFRVGKSLSTRSSLQLELNGTYIPLFKSFFVEGGKMYLRYSTVNMLLGYNLQLGAIFMNASMHYRILSTYENSQEDTNDFYITSFGINLTMGIKL